MSKLYFTLLCFFGFQSFSQLVSPTVSTINSPAENVETTIKIDENLIKREVFNNYEGFKLKNELTGKWMGYKMKILPDDFYLVEKDKNFNYYLSVNKSLIVNDIDTTFGALLVPIKGTKYKMAYFEKYKKVSEFFGVSKVEEIPQTEAKSLTIKAKPKMFFEFIYTGKIDKMISFTYNERETESNKIINSQELNYSLENNDLIGIRGATFKIIEAKPTTLKYMILKPFPEN
jgi:hypothetical protein